MIEPYYQRGDLTIYNADCREVLKQFEDKSFDLCLTDYPYGNQTDYYEYEDTPENLKRLIDDTMPEILRVSKRALITCGVANIHLYPRPTWTLCWFNPAGNGSGPWGFTCWQPVLAYGKDPYLQAGLGRRPDAWKKGESSEKVDHPCPKPTDYWTQLLLRGSIYNTDKILDPFCGSGTTLRVCKNTGRLAVGIELSKTYCDTAIRRLAQETMF